MERSEFEHAVPALYVIAGSAILAIWEDERGDKAMPQTSGKPLRAPILNLSLTTTWGARRVLSAFRRPESASNIDFVGPEGVIASAPFPARPPRLTADVLLAGLSSAEQVRALRFVLQTCRAAFGLGAHPVFMQFCREAVSQLAPAPAVLSPKVDITDDLILCEGHLPARFGQVRDVIVVGQTAVRRNAHLPADLPSGNLQLALEADALDDQLSVILFGGQSLACRSVELAQQRPRLLRWLEKARPSHALREYLAACLAASAEPASAATLREMQLLFPLPKAGVMPKDRPLGGEIELAASSGTGGLFVSGWLHDPHGLVKTITAVSAIGRRTPLGQQMHRFARPDVASHYGQATANAGFASFVPGDGEGCPSYQHRFELALHSGEIVHLVAQPQPATAVETRNAVLGSVPPTHLTDAVLAQAVGPAAASLHANHLAGKTAPDVVDFGQLPERPAVSIVVPLYKVLDFLRFQMAAFAVDPAMAEAELIYVLDSPEQRQQLEHLLRGLFALYGMPDRLLVMPNNYGFAAASNAGAAAARAPTVLFLNSDVVPSRAGWLSALRNSLDADARLAAVGPKLLFDDESLQHAGMYFDRDLTGKWFNLHYYKGMPRDFAPANQTREVPAVTGACLLVRRALIEQLGAFSEDYIIGDYEDSDLCLRLRQAGHAIGYVPQAELYHLERQSIQHHTGYTKTVACAYNRRLHADRWGWLMEELCGQPTATKATTATTKRRRKVAA